MTVETNKALYRRYIQEVFNEGQVEKTSEYLSADYVYREAPPGALPGAEGVRQVVRMIRAAFPDMQIALEELIAEGDVVCARSMMRGTHRGPFAGIAPTEKSIAVPGLTMVRIVGDKITESYVKNDMLALFAQLGASPPK